MIAFGQARNPLELQVDNDRIVVAGGQVFAIPRVWSFHQFLIWYGLRQLGEDWINRHLSGGTNHAVADHIRKGLFVVPTEVERRGQMTACRMNGDLYAFLAFSYDVFTVADNARIQASLLHRVRLADQYQGARYELFVAASLLRAGFTIDFEDESDLQISHCEFTATAKGNNKSFSVEAKSRHRDPESSFTKAGMYRILQDALLKNAHHERIIFADVNLPPDSAPVFQQDWHREVMSTLSELEDRQKPHDPWPQALIFFTNRKTSPWKKALQNNSTVLLSAINHPLFKTPDESQFKKEYPEIGRLFHTVNHLAAPPGEFFAQNAGIPPNL